ncbi:hypothetical protein BCR44DRAFT_1443981 [Catenaria anguillulae PL171]|uniref:Uncharacterized protein n=1 Tax=Catenaria anguillulae PL171 TaxID=765915 RepID=A0A1Y2HCH2_9FUNG|nr:hypothetical protein BCR44DRAFT_1443981 [Catenaria anguillulae PL171]
MSISFSFFSHFHAVVHLITFIMPSSPLLLASSSDQPHFDSSYTWSCLFLLPASILVSTNSILFH